MITIMKAKDRYFQDLGSLRVHSLFSFSNHYEPENLCFGDIFVFKDYLTKPGHGFGMHPHEDFEVILIYLQGEMLFQECSGTEVPSPPGMVHRITAGTGHAHKIINVGEEVSRYISIWMRPKMEGLAPSHACRHFEPQCWENKLFTLVSDTPPPLFDERNGCLVFNGRGAVSRCELADGASLTLSLPEDGSSLLYILYGELLLNEETMAAGDHARISAEKEILVQGSPRADFILVTTPEHSQGQEAPPRPR